MQGGVATIEGKTDVVQHKGVATRLAKSGGAVAVAAQVPNDIRSAFLNAAHNAFVTGLHVNAIIGVVGFVFLVFLTLTMLRHLQPHSESEGEAEPQYRSSQPTIHPKPDIQMYD